MLIKCTFSDGDYIEFDEKYLLHVKNYVAEAISIMVKEEATHTIMKTNQNVIDNEIEKVKIRDRTGTIKAAEPGRNRHHSCDP